MSLIVVLDSGPVGMITNPRATSANEACRLWLRVLLSDGIRVVLPEIVDYEIRRELVRGDKSAGLDRLNSLKNLIDYSALNTEVMVKAATLWAQARRQHRPTADDKALDIDVILASQALSLAVKGVDVVVATTNVEHLSLFVDAREWSAIGVR